MECNPATANGEYLMGIRREGINRLSIGLQSADDRELAALGRIHTFGDFLTTYDAARRAGFDNISADLMFGIPEQTRESFRDTLRRVTALYPEHLSVYGLILEEGTPFYRMRDTLALPDEDTESDMYRDAVAFLHERGYDRYEISNFSRRGRKSRHNYRYWDCREYLGFGVAAHSYFGGERVSHSRDFDGYGKGRAGRIRHAPDASCRRRGRNAIQSPLRRGLPRPLRRAAGAVHPGRLCFRRRRQVPFHGQRFLRQQRNSFVGA